MNQARLPKKLPNLALRILACALSLIFALSSAPYPATADTFDLGSPNATYSAEHLGQGNVTIRVGNQLKQITASSALTPAEYAAASQVLLSGNQTLTVNSSRVASTGSFSVNSNLPQSANSLTIPSGITAFANFASNSTFELAGVLTNFGTMYAYSTNTSQMAGTIKASSIINNHGTATITSLLPYPIATSISAAPGNFDLHLVANSIENKGSISASGNLTLEANSITTNINGGFVAWGGDTVFISPYVFMNGGGTSATGNLIFRAPAGADLVVNLQGGSVLKAGGDLIVEIPQSTSANKLSLSIIHQNYVAGDIFIDAPDASVSAFFLFRSNPIHLEAGPTMLEQRHGLLLGRVNVTGDSVFMCQRGDIRISDAITSNGHALIFASDLDIIALPSSSISTSPLHGGSGGKLTMLSGVYMDAINTTPSLSVDLRAQGYWTQGGAIDLSAMQHISTAGTLEGDVGGNGGDIFLAAQRGSLYSQTPGVVYLNPVSGTNSAGAGIGAASGNIKIFAGGANPAAGVAAVKLSPNISGAGDIEVFHATPVGTLTVSGGSATGGSINAGEMKATQFGTESSPVVLNQRADSLSIHTAGDIYLQQGPNSTPIESIEFGNKFRYTSEGNIAIAGNVTSAEPNSSVEIINTFDGDTNASITQDATSRITAANIFITTEGDASVRATASKTLSVHAEDSLQISDSSSGGPLIASAGSDLRASGNLSAAAQMELVSGLQGASRLEVLPGATLTATNTLMLHNKDSESGSLSIGENSTIRSTGKVYVLVGERSVPEHGTAPETVQVVETNNGKVFFGSGEITAEAPTTITANLNNVVLNNQGDEPITLGAGSSITAGYGNPRLTVNSLDLTDPVTVQEMLMLQQQHPSLVGGTLEVTDGVVTGGTLIFSSNVSLEQLFSANIPSGVTVTFNDFQQNTPINLFLDSNSFTPHLIIAGTARFIGTTAVLSDSRLNVTSQNDSLGASISGQLVSDGALTITVNRDISISGVAEAAGLLSIKTSGTASEDVLLSGNLVGGTVSINVAGTGEIVQSAGLIAGNSITLTSQSGNMNLRGAVSARNQLTATLTGGNMTIAAGMTSGPLNSGSGGTISILANSIVFESGALISADALGAGRNNGGAISLSAKTIVSTASESILLTANASGIGKGGSISMTTTDTNTGFLSIENASSSFNLSATGGSIESSTGDGGSISLSSGHTLRIDTAAITAAPLGTNGQGSTLSFNGGHDVNTTRPGLLTIVGDLNADGVGTGTGGSITLKSGTTGLTVDGSISANSTLGSAGTIELNMYAGSWPTFGNLSIGNKNNTHYISGTIEASSQEGKAGTLTIRNRAPLNINLTSSISLTGPLTAGYGALNLSGSYASYTANGNGSLQAAVGGRVTNFVSTIPGTLYLGTFDSLNTTEVQHSGGDVILQGPLFTTQCCALKVSLVGAGSLYQLPGSAIGGGIQFRSDTGNLKLLGNQNTITLLSATTHGNVELFTKSSLVVDALNDPSMTVTSEVSILFGHWNNIRQGDFRAPKFSISGYATVTSIGDITFESSVPGGPLELNLDTNPGGIKSTTGNITFNPHNPSRIKMINYGGTIAAPAGKIVMNAGSSNSLFALGTFVGTVEATGSTIQIGKENAPITLGNVLSTYDIHITASDVTANANISAGTSVTINVAGTIAGAGTLVAPGGITIETANDLTFAGQTNFRGNTVINAVPKTVTVSQGPPVVVNGSLTVNALNLVNPNGFDVSGTATFNIANGGGTEGGGTGGGGYGTIVNYYGDLILTKDTIINANGAHVALVARGNILSDGVTTINLSNANGKGGSLSVFAGVDFGPVPQLPVPQSIDHGTTFAISGPSSIGGSINFDGVTINTSSTYKTSNAGNVHLFANKGSDAIGAVNVGTITAKSSGGRGGNVVILATGGIVVAGSIVTSGAAGGGHLILHGAGMGNDIGVTVTDGHLWELPNLTHSPEVGSGSAVTVVGTIDASSSRGTGGSVDILADSFISLKAIKTKGLSGGGNVLISSNSSYVETGGIDASATNLFGPSNASNGGSGGEITVSAPSWIFINGSLLSRGGSTTGSGKGGNAGAITVFTSDAHNIGNILLKGTVDARGGNVPLSSLSAAGLGGDVTLRSGALQVTGTSIVNGIPTSIVTSGGLGRVQAIAGAVNIDTFATQNLPKNFSLNSTTMSEYALPGGLFTIGVPTVINGTKGAIQSNNYKAVSHKTTAPIVAGPITVTAHGANVNLTVAGTIESFGTMTAGSSTLRRKVTPAQALALYQQSTGAPQTLRLSSGGLIEGSQGNASTVTIYASHLPQRFTGFVLAASDPNGINLTVTGSNPVLDVSTSSTFQIRGSIIFDSPGSFAWVNAGSKPVEIPTGSEVSAAPGGALIFSTRSFTNHGDLGGRILIAQRSLTIQSSTATESIGLIPSEQSGTVNFNTDFIRFIDLFGKQIPTAFRTLSIASLQSTQPGTLTLNITGGQQSTLLEGSYQARSIVINNQTGDLNYAGNGTLLTRNDLTIKTAGRIALNGSLWSTNGLVSVTSGQGAQINDGIWAEKGITVSSGFGDLIVHGSVATETGMIRLSTKTSAILGGNFRSGGYEGQPYSANNQQRENAGQMLVTAGGRIEIVYGSFFYSNLGDITFKASGGGISLGGNTAGQCCYGRIYAIGGDLNLLAAGSIVQTGYPVGGMELVAFAEGGKGGIINISAGTLSTTFSSTVLNHVKGTRPVAGSIGTFMDRKPSNGVVIARPSGGPINISNAEINISGGGLALQTAGSATIDLQRVLFATSGYQKVSFENPDDELESEFIVDVDEDFEPLEFQSASSK